MIVGQNSRVAHPVLPKTWPDQRYCQDAPIPYRSWRPHTVNAYREVIQSSWSISAHHQSHSVRGNPSRERQFPNFHDTKISTCLCNEWMERGEAWKKRKYLAQILFIVQLVALIVNTRPALLRPMSIDKISAQSNLAKGRIADLSSLDAANGFVRFWPNLIHGIGPTRVSPPNGMSIGSAVLNSTSVWPTHRHTDHATCDICRNMPHICYAYNAA